MSDDGVQITPEISIAYVDQKFIVIEAIFKHFKHDVDRELFKRGGSRKAAAKRTQDEGQVFEVTHDCGMRVDKEFQAT
jgi:hypothetical protein